MSINEENSDKQIGNYRLIRLLGRGGFADVYLGEHVYLHTQAALKLLHTHLDAEGIEMFRTEALTIAHLTHPHIVRVLDFEVENSLPFLVMDYAPNGSLRQRCPKGTLLPPYEIISYTKQVASALQYAHERHLVHRDVKPENMLLDAHNEVLLSDFGIALVIHTSRSQHTDENVIGTISYMAPEQIQGKARPASDQYALAAVVYEWISGQRLFKGSYIEIMSQHLTTPPPSLSEQMVGVPVAVEHVLRRALAKDPQQRFPCVQDFADALEAAYQAGSYSVRESANVLLPSSSEPAAIPPLPAPVQPTLYATPVQSVQQMSPPALPQPVSLPPARAAAPPLLTPSTFQRPAHGVKMARTGGLLRVVSKLVKRSLVLFILLLLLAVGALCGGGYALIHYYLTPHASTGTTTAGALEQANTFLDTLKIRRYDQAYTLFGQQIGQTMGDFRQQMTDEDGCYGALTKYTENQNSETVKNSSVSYAYSISRARMVRPYQLQLTLQKNSAGQWQITDYNSNLTAVQRTCPT